MKILHVVPSYFPAVRYGGPIWSVHGLAAGQAALGHDVHVFTTNADGPGESAVPTGTPVDLDGVKVTYFPIGAPRRLFRAPAMAKALAQSAGDFDVIHLHSVFLWPTLVAARAARRANTPYVLSPRGMLVASLIRAKSSLVKRLWLSLFERRTIDEAAAIHVTAAREAEDFATLGLTAHKVIALPNGVEPPPLDDGALVSDDVARAVSHGDYALYLGRINWKKNLPALVAAFADVPNLKLVIAGNDEDKDGDPVRAAIAEHHLANRVTLVARSVDGADKEALFAGAAMFVLPSLNENFGNTVLEAMVRGKPVVVSEAAGVADVVRDTGAGLVCAPEAPALAAALRVLTADPAAARQMGEAGRAAALDRYGWKTVAADMVAAYAALSRA